MFSHQEPRPGPRTCDILPYRMLGQTQTSAHMWTLCRIEVANIRNHLILGKQAPCLQPLEMDMQTHALSEDQCCHKCSHSSSNMWMRKKCTMQSSFPPRSAFKAGPALQKTKTIYASISWAGLSENRSHRMLRWNTRSSFPQRSVKAKVRARGRGRNG